MCTNVLLGIQKQEKYQSPEEYQEHLRRSREQQVAAEQRRKQQAIARKERAAREREQGLFALKTFEAMFSGMFFTERLKAEERQKKKVEAKKAQLEANRKSSEERTKEILRSAQNIRSSVFSAARKGQSDLVKKGVWEDGIDAAGGEIKPGCSTFVNSTPSDLQETLLHIATKNGDLGLVKWLDSHSKPCLIVTVADHTRINFTLRC